MDIRPLRQQDMDALLGRRLLRPRPVPAGGSVPATNEAGEGVAKTARAAAARQVDFAANVDGPWQHRDQAELAVELARLARYIAQVRTPGVGCAPEDLTPVEAYLHGAAAAAMWTVGLTDRAPAGTHRLVVSNRTIDEQLQATEQRAGEPGQLRGNAASGAAAWLAWLTGRWPEMEYPGG